MNIKYDISRYEKDRKISIHFHDHFEILLSLSNGGKFFVRKESYPIVVGSLFCLNISEIHHCFSEKDQTYDRYVVHFPEETLHSISTPATNMLKLFNNSSSYTVVDLQTLALMQNQLDTLLLPIGKTYGADIQRNILFVNFLLTVAAAVKANAREPVHNSPDFKLASAIIDYIQNHIAEELSREQIAKSFFISASHVGQVFKKATGFSLGEYIINYRIQRACSLLQDGVKIKEIGNMVGFKNASHFTRIFKKRVGLSPSDFMHKQETYLKIL